MRSNYTNEELLSVGAKYAVFGQTFIEVLDDMQDTPLYKHKTKKLIKSLMKELEKNEHIAGLFKEGQKIVTDISMDVDDLVERRLKEITEELLK